METKVNGTSPYSGNGSTTQASIDAPLTQVYQTRDYTKFRNLHGNRIIRLAHVKRLTESFSDKQLICPIIVNDSYEIIDGQHRFMVCKELDLPIHYVKVKNYGLKEVQKFNSNNAVWNKREYLESYCSLGLRPYLEFKRFAAMFPNFPLTVCGMLLSGRAGVNTQASRAEGHFPKKDFETGNFIIKDFERAVKYGHRIEHFASHYKGYTKPLFVRTLMQVFKNKEYSHDTMVKKLKTAGNTKLNDQKTVKQYLYLLEEIFNYKNRSKINLHINKNG